MYLWYQYFLKNITKIHIDNNLWNNKLDNLQIKPIKNIEWYDFPEELDINKYEISKCGQIRNKTSMQILKPILQNRQYYVQVGIYFEDIVKNMYIHLLVAYTFIKKVDL